MTKTKPKTPVGCVCVLGCLETVGSSSTCSGQSWCGWIASSLLTLLKLKPAPFSSNCTLENCTSVFLTITTLMYFISPFKDFVTKSSQQQMFLVSWSFHHFGPDWNILKIAIGWISMKLWLLWFSDFTLLILICIYSIHWFRSNYLQNQWCSHQL